MLPGELKKGDRLTADWLNRLVREEVARTLKAGPGVRINRTPSGSTISATGHSARAAAAPAESDFPWRVTATPDGEGGATLNMSPGAIIADTANGPVLCGGIALPANQRQISSSGYVVVRIGADDPTSCQVSYAAAVPANTPAYNYIPVAQVTKSGNLYTVSQYLAGAFLAIATVNEEI